MNAKEIIPALCFQNSTFSVLPRSQLLTNLEPNFDPYTSKGKTFLRPQPCNPYTEHTWMHLFIWIVDHPIIHIRKRFLSNSPTAAAFTRTKLHRNSLHFTDYYKHQTMSALVSTRLGKKNWVTFKHLRRAQTHCSKSKHIQLGELNISFWLQVFCISVIFSERVTIKIQQNSFLDLDVSHVK